jgi:transposase
MQGKQRYNQALFVSLDLDQFVPQDHRLRKIDHVLDLFFVRQLTSDLYCKGEGRPSIDPVVFFKMQVIKYLYGISSDRQLCADVHVNLAYRWFLRLPIEEKVPDHSSLTKIRDRLGENVFKEAFEKIVEQCQKAGLLKGKQMLTDATLIEANASLNSLVKNEDLGKTRVELKAGKIKAKEETAAHPDIPSGKSETYTPKTHASRTDPDSTVVRRDGYRSHLYYKSHCTIDGAKRIITDCFVTTGSKHECTVFKERVDYVTQRFNLKPEEWLADRGYCHGPAYDFLRGKKIRAYIPLRDKRLGRGKNSPTKGFKFQRKTGRYICPQGHEMMPHKPEPGYTRYVVKNGACKTCPVRQSCLGDSKLASKRINRALHQDEFDALHKRSVTKHFKRKLRERSVKIEGVFGEDKVNHCLDRALYRGRSKMQMQVYMISIVHNLKRMANAAAEAATSFVLDIASVLAFFIRSAIFIKKVRLAAL